MTETTMHPFAGGIPYPWQRPEAQALYEALIRSITSIQEIDLYVKTYAPGAQALNLAVAPPLLWKDALQTVSLADGLVELCRKLATVDRFVAVAQAAKDMLEARPQVQRRMGKVDQRLVVDRLPFRDYMTELGTDASTVKVLLVRGGPGTGKTWSRYLFEWAAEDRGADSVYLDSGVVGTVREVVDKLFSKLDAIDRVPPTDTTDIAWFRTVCNRLPDLAERRRDPRPLWIAVDDLGPGPDGVTPLMDPEILQFFEQFVRHFVDRSTQRWFRLLLIHYPGEDVPTKWDQEVWKEDRTHPEDITAADVVDVFHEWAADHHRDLVEDQVRAAAQDVIVRAEAPLPATDPRSRHRRMRRIHDEIRGELARLAQRGGAP